MRQSFRIKRSSLVGYTANTNPTSFIRSAREVAQSGRHDTQHNYAQHNDNQHNGTQHNDSQHNDTQHYGLVCDTEHKLHRA